MNTYESEIDVNAESSSETHEQTEQNHSEPAQAEPSAQPAAKSEDNVPFHMHPRFQELVSQRNSDRERASSLERQLQQLQEQIKSSQPAQKDELMERLKNIDPAFAERFGKIGEVDSLKAELAELRSFREEMNRQSVQQRVQSAKDAFYAENKIPDDRKEIYEAMLVQAVSSNPEMAALPVSELPKVLKTLHDRVGKLFSTVERQATKTLVDQRKADAAKPLTAKSGQAKPVNQEKQMSKAELRAAMKAEILAEAGSGNDI